MTNTYDMRKVLLADLRLCKKIMPKRRKHLRLCKDFAKILVYNIINVYMPKYKHIFLNQKSMELI